MARTDEGESQSTRNVASRARGANGSACDKCRKRKIRCTGERPACARCVRLNHDCIYPGLVGNDSTIDYLKSLQDQVRELEARRDSLQRSSPEYFFATTTHISPANSSNVAGDRAPRENVSPSGPLRPSVGRGDLQVEVEPGIALSPPPRGSWESVAAGSKQLDTVTLEAPRVPPPEPDIPSPRYEAMQTTYPKPHDRPLPSNDQVLLHLPSDLGVSFFERNSNQPPPLTTRITSLVRIDRTVLPSAQNLNYLVSHFETYTAAAFPIFHIPTLRDWVDKVCFKGEPVEPEVACSVLLVLAVSATSVAHGSAQEHLKTQAPALWEYGQKFLPPVFLPPIDEVRGLFRVQVMLIRLQYVLYNPSAGNVWGLSGAAVRASVDLGLHHESGLPGNNRSAMETDIRRRVFWICDRDLGMALGRPPAIQDEWVTAEYPCDRDDSLISASGIDNGPPAASKLTAIHLFRIRRLQSEIIFCLYASGRRQTPTIDWMNNMQSAIEEWYAARPSGTGFCSDQWLNLCYHQTVTLLHRPCPGNPQPARESLVKALQGSSATMRLYKEVYRTGRSNFGWLSMYHLFISGVTYLNSLWQGYRNGWRLVPSYVDALLDMQVCTSVMEGLASLTPGAVSIRNTWETVSEKMIRQLSANARWDPPSRQGSPSFIAPQETNSAGQNVPDPFTDSANGMLGLDNPFDSFLLHPLGEMSTDDWARAVSFMSLPFQPGEELQFS